jgi:hypothetical protein
MSQTCKHWPTLRAHIGMEYSLTPAATTVFEAGNARLGAYSTVKKSQAREP